MKKISFTFILCFIISTFLTSTLLAETLYIRSYKAIVFKSPKMGSKKVKKLPRGSKVEVLERKGRWVKIQFNNSAGWVSKMSLSKKAKKGKISLLARNISLEKTARRRANFILSNATDLSSLCPPT